MSQEHIKDSLRTKYKYTKEEKTALSWSKISFIDESKNKIILFSLCVFCSPPSFPESLYLYAHPFSFSDLKLF